MAATEHCWSKPDCDKMEWTLQFKSESRLVAGVLGYVVVTPVSAVAGTVIIVTSGAPECHAQQVITRRLRRGSLALYNYAVILSLCCVMCEFTFV